MLLLACELYFSSFTVVHFLKSRQRAIFHEQVILYFSSFTVEFFLNHDNVRFSMNRSYCRLTLYGTRGDLAKLFHISNVSYVHWYQVKGDFKVILRGCSLQREPHSAQFAQRWAHFSLSVNTKLKWGKENNLR